MRKCAQCGKDIPTGNSSCNYCGYNPGEMNKKSSYSFGKVTNGPKVNLNVNGSKTGKIILIIFFMYVFCTIYFRYYHDDCNGNFIFN